MTGTNPPGELSPFSQHQTILAKNTGSTDIPVFGLCRWLGWAIDAELGVHLNIEKYTTTSKMTRVASPQIAVIKAGKFGPVTMISDHPTLIQIDSSGTPNVGEIWGPLANSFGMAENFLGLFIVGAKQTVANVSVAMVVRFPHDLMFKATADADITSSGSALVSMFLGAGDSGINVTAHLLHGEGGEKVSSGKEIYVRWFEIENQWQWIGGECED